ncbi:Hypothetical protein FKW44_000648 [Caligus rogercresseyi]|uniref:Uncharacterized protein n=1 Tax=Caligus rogercresseyi TaxID=217165 RepID=A0A7T8QV15_CALRO|nr:Hypothetical protein FKW44_000648 [Caligus rogercresseyi]
MGPWVPPNLIGCFGVTIHHQWALSVPPNTIREFWGYNPPPMGPWVPPNLIGVIWGYKSTTNGPSGSAEHNRGVLGLQIPRQWALGFRQTQSGCLGYISPANGPSRSAEQNYFIFGLHVPCQWALGFRQTQSSCFWVTNPPPMDA